MISLRNFIFGIIVFCIAIALYARFIADIPIRKLLGQGKPAAESQTSPKTGITDTTLAPGVDAPREGAPSTGGQEKQQQAALEGIGTGENPATFNFEELEKTLDLIDPKQRTALLDNEESFRNFVKKEAANKSVDAAAHANKIDQKPLAAARAR